MDHLSFSKEDVKNLQVYTEDPRIVSIFEFVRGCTSGGKTWERFEHALACRIADGLGQAPEQMAASLARFCEGLVEDEGSEISDGFVELFGFGFPCEGSSRNVQACRLTGVAGAGSAMAGKNEKVPSHLINEER